MRIRPIPAFACATVLLAGCTGLSQKINSDVDRSNTNIAALVKDVGRAVPGAEAKQAPSVAHEDGIWLGRSIAKGERSALPPIFYEPASFDRSVASLAEFAERVTLRIGIPAKATPDALAASGASAPAAQSAGSGAAPLPAGRPGAASQLPPAMREGGPTRITYNSGNLKGLLDVVAARFGVYWKYSNGTIEFYYTDSRTFQISAIPGDSSLSATVTSGAITTGGIASGTGMGGTAGGAGNGSSGVSTNNRQNTAVTSQLSVYSSIEKAVTAMLSPYGRVVASPATGAITVVDTPDRLERISNFIERENKALSRQVVINVTVLSVNLSDADEYGINWDLVYTGLKEKYGIRNTVAATPGSTAFSAGILSTASSNWAGSTLLINALSQQGKVRRQTTASVVTLNNQPVPVQVAKQTSYLQSSQTTITALVGSTTTLVPGTVTSGFNMSILPNVLANGTVMLQFSTDISSLRQIRTVSSNGSSIETPEIDTRNFLQRVAMKSNETLVISGFEQTDDNIGNQGVGQPKNYLFGGGYKARSDKEVIVVLITPAVVSGS